MSREPPELEAKRDREERSDLQRSADDGGVAATADASDPHGSVRPAS
jgi:hypothetical protein